MRGVRVTGVDISESMLAIPKERAADLAIDPDLRLGDAEALEFGDSSSACRISACSVERDEVRRRPVRVPSRRRCERGHVPPQRCSP